MKLALFIIGILAFYGALYFETEVLCDTSPHYRGVLLVDCL